MKHRYPSFIVLILFLFIAIIAAVSLAAASSPAVVRPGSINPVLPARTQAGRDLQQTGSLALIGCPIVPITGIFVGPQASGPPQDWLIQGTCVEFDWRSEDNQWIRIRSGENLVSHPGWVAAGDVLLERPLDQLPTAVSSSGGATPSSTSITGESEATPSSGGLSACLESVNSLNLRSGPGIAYRSVAYLLKGSCVTLTARTASAAWVKSDKGWMATYYLQVQGDLNQLPVP
jgi:hypothetical protein